MPAFEQPWFYLLATLVAGVGLGVLLARWLSDRYAHVKEVRWKRRLSEMQAAHELSTGTLTKTLNHALEKQENLRRALAESDETVTLLSANNGSVLEQDVTERNIRIAELDKKLSRARARLDDATDQETTLQKQIDSLHGELGRRDQRIDDLLSQNAEFSGLGKLNSQHEQRFADLENELADREQRIAEMTQRLQKFETQTPDYQRELRERDSRLVSLNEQFEDMRQKLPTLNDALREREASIDDLIAELSQERERALSLEQKIAHIKSVEEDQMKATHGGAKVVSIHKHLQTDDLIEQQPVAEQDEDTEHRVRTLERELETWKRKYEAANSNKNSITSELPVAKRKSAGERPKSEARVKDDLKLIRGIGPVLEAALNELGVFRFEQLAGMSQPDIEQMTRYDSSLPGRIRRYKWVEQARKLQEAQLPDRYRPHV